jgi:2-oxoisovalerate dehydrogenase E2 component (dihydrolipoyl transacylase)
VYWHVQPGARVTEFDTLCEVTSDKASTEITSRYTGVIKKLYYDAEDIAIVGKPLVDIDVDEEIAGELENMAESAAPESDKKEEVRAQETVADETPKVQEPTQPSNSTKPVSRNASSNGTLATPATRHLSKELGIDISQVNGTGKDGRVMKEDVQRFASEGQSTTASAPITATQPAKEDTVVRISGIQAQMFKAMTKSLSIPHFLYSDSVDMTATTSLRKRLNASNKAEPLKLSPLPFIIKATSLALQSFPSLNAHLDTSDPAKPVLTHKSSHNIGVAIDTPAGLVVPVIKNVQSLSIIEIATETARLSSLARSGKLTTSDLSGATFTISNIGSIGGGAVAPVIVGPQVAILGVGRAKEIPAFGEDGSIVRKQEAVFSWSADHRVVDGAMVARCADRVRELLEGVESMVVQMR